MKKLLIITALILMLGVSVYAENIDPDNSGRQYAWGENIGWVNFEPNVSDPNAGATVSRTKLSGYIWAENIGWINLSPYSYGGVLNDGYGDLSGYAWGENVGWINFNPTVTGDPNHYGVQIDKDGNFSGWAWGENIGWIHFSSTAPVNYGVRACVVGFVDLKNFVQQWLMNGMALSADLNGSTHVDFADYSIFSLHWLDFCPDNWPLK